MRTASGAPRILRSRRGLERVVGGVAFGIGPQCIDQHRRPHFLSAERNQRLQQLLRLAQALRHLDRQVFLQQPKVSEHVDLEVPRPVRPRLALRHDL